MFGVGFTQGFQEGRERTRNRRAKVFDAFQRWKADNPYATAADFQNAVRAIGGGDLTVANSLPGQQAIQRMASENQRRKQEDDLRKKRAAISEQLQMQNTMLGLVSNAVQMYGDKVDANMLSKQFGVPADMIQPALDQAQAKAAQAKAEKDQAAQLEALEIYTSTLNTMIANGSTPEQATAAANARSNRYLKAAGVDVSLGNVGAPSQFASNIDAANAEAKALYDIRVNKEARDAANSIRTLFGSNASLQDLLINDEQEAINAAFAFAGLDLDDDVAAAVRADLEGTIGEMSRQIREQRDNAAVQTITPLFESARDADPNSVVDPQAAAEAAINAAVAQGMPVEVAEEAMQTTLSNYEGLLTKEYNDRFQPADPADVINAAIAGRAQAAGEIVSAMTGKVNKDGVPIFGTEVVVTGSLDPALIADALADINYGGNTALAQDIATFMAKTMMEMKAGKNGATATKEQLIKAAKDKFEVGTFSDYIADNQDTLLMEIDDDFASTAELIKTDLERQEAIDQNYGGLDITMDGIKEASGDKAMLDQIDIALDEMIVHAQAHLAAFEMGAINLDKMTGIDPQARLAFGQVLDRDAYAAAVRGRIVELEQRQKQVNEARVKAQPNGDQNVRPLSNPDPINSFITVGRQSFPVSVPGTKVFFTEAIEAMDTKPDAYKAFEDSLLQTLQLAAEDTKDSPGLATGAPTLYKAITGPVADERVVRGMAEALEAFDYLNALPTSSKSVTNGNANYRQIITGLGIADDFGSSFYIDDAEKDGHAQAYALSWFMDAISGMDEETQQVLGVEFAAVLRALDRPGGNARNDLSGGLRTLDLPRFRESAF